MIAALFVQKGGAYFDLPGVDPWGEARDARLYDGPHAVVAHPPCARWCRLAGFVEARFGHKRGDDGGCFASALTSVRRFGGVLEHPAFSAAWPHFGLLRPPVAGGWSEQAGIVPGAWLPPPGWRALTAHVEQGRYGHPQKKATWLYAVVPERLELPDLRWGFQHDATSQRGSSWCGFPARGELRELGLTTGPRAQKKRLTKRETIATPPDFRAVLLDIARQVELCR